MISSISVCPVTPSTRSCGPWEGCGMNAFSGHLHGHNSVKCIFFDCNRSHNLDILRIQGFKQGPWHILKLFSSHKNLVCFFLGCEIFSKTFETYLYNYLALKWN